MIVCVKCSRQMRPKRNGVEVVEQARQRSDEAPDKYWDYKLWMADLWECQDCGTHVPYVGDRHGQQAFREHFQEGFAERVQEVGYRAKEWTR